MCWFCILSTSPSIFPWVGTWLKFPNIWHRGGHLLRDVNYNISIHSCQKVAVPPTVIPYCTDTHPPSASTFLSLRLSTSLHLSVYVSDQQAIRRAFHPAAIPHSSHCLWLFGKPMCSWPSRWFHCSGVPWSRSLVRLVFLTNIFWLKAVVSPPSGGVKGLDQLTDTVLPTFLTKTEIDRLLISLFH